MADKSFFTRAVETLGFGSPDPGPDDSIEKRGPAIPTATLGTSQLYAGDIGAIAWAPDRRLNVIGQQRFLTFDNMLRDHSIVATGVRLLLNLMGNAIWTVNPPDGLNDNELAVAQGYADQAYDAIYSMTTSWADVVRKVAMFRFIGFSIMEWTAKRNDDGTIGFLDIEHRPQRTIARWVRDDSGTIEAVVQRVSGRQEVVLPRSKVIYAVDNLLTDNPEGVGLFRHLATTADRLEQFLDLEEVGFTTDLRGIPIARAPLGDEKKKAEQAGPIGSDAREKAEAVRARRLQPLKDFIEKHIRSKQLGVMLPSDTYEGKTADGATTPSSVPKWSLELLNGSSSAFDAMANAVKRLNHDMARILGVDHLLLGQDGGGSLALARSKVGTFYLTVSSTLQDLVEVFDRDVMEPLAELNGWPDHLRPEMGVNEINDRDIADVTAALKDMATAGAVLMPGDPAIGEVRDMIGLSRPPETSSVDLSLVPGRKGTKQPVDPNTPLDQNPEDQGQPAVAKARIIKSRRRRLRKRSG